MLEVKCAASATNLKRIASREDYQRKKSAKLESRERNACRCADYDVLLKDLQESKRKATPVYHGVPQGSVLGPVMFNVYTTPIADICKKHQVHYHRFADDIQLYVSYNPAESDELNYAKIQLIQCIDEIRAWMLLHQLKLNDNKTEFMVLQSSHNLRVHGSPTLQLSQLTLSSTDTARNLGCFFDRHMELDRLSRATVPQPIIICERSATFAIFSHSMRATLLCEVSSLAALTTAMRYSVV